MGYINDLEPKIREFFALGDEQGLIKWLKDTVLESYRNGQASVSGKSGSESKPQKRYFKRSR